MNYSVSPCFFGVPEKDGIYQVSYEITNRCNLHCLHCMNRSDDLSTTNDGLEWESISLLLEEMKDNNVKELYISGGEPTLYPHFEKLIKKSKTLGIDTLLATNAYDIEPWLDEIKENISVVFVSIDGAPDKHDYFRGKSGAYSKSLNNIRKMIAMDIPVRISTVVSQNNINDLECIISELCDIGVFQVHFTVLVNVGRASDGEMLIDSNQYRELSGKIRELQKKYEKEGFIITTRRNGKLNDRTEPCFAGRRMVHINASGVISPCSYLNKCKLGLNYSMKWEAGNFKECLAHAKRFQSVCKEREKYFGYSSCAALASISADSDSLWAVDPLDEVW